MPAMPRMPGISELVSLLQQQTEALASLPRTMLDLNRSILSLIDVVASARDTIASSQRVSARLERIVDEMEEPVLALRPGLERLAVILDDPAVDTVPDTLRKINEEVLPLVKGIQDTQTKVNNIASLAEETSNRLAGLPGAAFLLGRRRPQPTAGAEPGATTAQPASEADQPVSADQPGADQPGADQPGADQPGADQPAAEPTASGADQPGEDARRPTQDQPPDDAGSHTTEA